MKIIIFAVLIYLVLNSQNPRLAQCTFDTAKLGTGPRVWAEQSSDSFDQNTLVTRALHNKVSVFISEISKCYVNFYEPLFMLRSVGIIGTFFWVYFVYYLTTQHKIIFFVLATLPIFPMYNLFTVSVHLIHKLFAIIGAAIFINKKL